MLIVCFGADNGGRQRYRPKRTARLDGGERGGVERSPHWRRRPGPRRSLGYTVGPEHEEVPHGRRTFVRLFAAIFGRRFAQRPDHRRGHPGRCWDDLACRSAVNRQEPNMPDNIRFSNPDTMQKPPGQPPGYSHVVEVTGPGRTVYFAGQLGIDKAGRMGADAREQMEIAFENVKAALASVGARFEQVVKLNNYIVDIGTSIAHYREVRDKYVNKSAPPASTTIGVPQFARPGALFEVEAIAVLPPK